MWEVRSQYNKPNVEAASDDLEWSAVLVETEEEALRWWNTRTSYLVPGSVSTLFNPDGDVIKVVFGPSCY